MAAGTQVASLFGVLSLEDSQFQSGLKNADKGLGNTQSRLKDFSTGLKNVGAGLIAVTGPVVAFGVASIKAAMDSQNAIAQLDAVIKSTGGSAGVTSEHAQELASSLQNMTTYSDEVTMSAESMLLTFTNIGANGGIFDQATLTALNMSTALGQDLTSSAMQLGKALNNPIEGITALTRVGVTFTQAQKDQIKAMTDAGNVAGAQGIILAELNKEFGGSAVAAGTTFAGSLEILKNKFNDVQEKIGGVFLPILSNLVTNGITPVIDKISDWVSKNPTLVLQIGAVALGGLALGGVLTVIGMVLPAVISGISLLLSPVALLAIAIAALVIAASQLYPGGIQQLLKDASKAAQDLANIGLFVLIDTLKRASDTAKELIQMGLLVLMDTLNKAAIAAGMLALIVEFAIVSALHNASIAAQDLVNGFRDWIDKNKATLEQLGDLGLSLVLAIGIIKLYQVGVALAAAASGFGSGLAGAISAAAGAAWASISGFVAAAAPVVVLTLAIYAAIEAYKKFSETAGYLNKAANDTAAAVPKGMSHDDFMAKAFNAAVAQFGDLGARIWWDNQGRLIMESVWARSQGQARAMGGPVAAGQSYLVGEQGPEMFTPSSSGNITNARDTQRMMSGGDTYNLTIYANDYAGGQAAYRGFSDAARAKGH